MFHSKTWIVQANFMTTYSPEEERCTVCCNLCQELFHRDITIQKEKVSVTYHNYSRYPRLILVNLNFVFFLLRQFTRGNIPFCQKIGINTSENMMSILITVIRKSESAESKENYDVPHRSQTIFPYILVYYHALRVRSVLNTLSRGNTRGRAFKHWLQCTLRDTLL